jgi:hypothetical protein
VLRVGVWRFALLQHRRFARCENAYAILQSRPPEGEREYKDFPWKQCFKSRKTEIALDGCCSCLPWL